jgi:hypothetical protein
MASASACLRRSACGSHLGPDHGQIGVVKRDGAPLLLHVAGWRRHVPLGSRRLGVQGARREQRVERRNGRWHRVGAAVEYMSGNGSRPLHPGARRRQVARGCGGARAGAQHGPHTYQQGCRPDVAGCLGSPTNGDLCGSDHERLASQPLQLLDRRGISAGFEL